MRPTWTSLSVALLGIAALVGCRDGGSGSGSPAVQTTNLALNVSCSDMSAALLAFEVSETFEGATDLNADGDASDNVLHVHDLETGVTRNLGLATRNRPRACARLAAFTVNENSQGATDLNGDGDAFDGVPHLYDAVTQTTSNLGIAGSSQLLLEGDWLVFLASEFGEQADLNGDGDQDDEILHVYRISTGVLTNVGLATFPGAIRFDGITVAVAILEETADLNGDGDATDLVLHLYTPATGTLENLGFALRSFALAGLVADLQLANGTAAFGVREDHQGNTDLDGDGLADDTVIHVREVASGTTRNLGFAITPSNDYRTGDDLVALRIVEALQGGGDLNGDGDVGDAVLFVHDPTTGVTTNLALAIGSYRVHGDLVLAEVPEQDQAGADLNGDGDATDRVLHAYVGAAQSIANIRVVADRAIPIDPVLLAVDVDEILEGGVDLNGDGDIVDRIPHVYHLLTGVLTRLSVSGISIQADEGFLAVGAFEEASDLNGDGDLNDRVLHFYDTATGRLRNAGLAGSWLDASGFSFGFENGTMPFAVDELEQGENDLNGDGDDFDMRILHVVQVGK